MPGTRVDPLGFEAAVVDPELACPASLGAPAFALRGPRGPRLQQPVFRM